MPTDDREHLASLFHAAPGQPRPGDQTPGDIADMLIRHGYRRDTGAEEILTGLADAIRDYYSLLTLHERTQLVEVLDEHGIDIDLDGGAR
jgi:hypothetical protein